MTTEPRPLEMELPATPESVAQARHALVRYGERCDANLANLSTAVSEAVANVVQHAYRGTEPGTIRIAAGLEGNDLVLQVSDHGIGMRPNPESKGLGMGLKLIAASTSEVDLKTRPDGLTISMRFPCPG